MSPASAEWDRLLEESRRIYLENIELRAEVERLRAVVDAARVRERFGRNVSCPDGTDADEPADRGFVCCHQYEADMMRAALARLYEGKRCEQLRRPRA
jgi:hypothetical protein